MRKTAKGMFGIVLLTALMLAAAAAYPQNNRDRREVVVSVVRPENGERDPALERVVHDTLDVELGRVGFRVVSFRSSSFPLRLVGGDEKVPRMTDILTLTNASGADYAIIGLYSRRDDGVRTASAGTGRSPGALRPGSPRAVRWT